MTLLPQHRDRLALGAAVVALILGVAAATLGSYDAGIGWRIDDDRVHVEDVAHLSQAERDGVQPGMIATSINFDDLILLPAYQYGELDPDQVDALPPIIGVAPSAPTNAYPNRPLQSLIREPVTAATLIAPSNLEAGGPDRWAVNSYFYPGAQSFGWAQLALLPGLLILLGGAAWLRSGSAGPGLRELALPLAVAVAAPLLVMPLAAIGTFLPVVTAHLVTVAAMVPLALGLADRIDRPDDRRLVLLGIAAAAVLAVVVIFGQATGNPVRAGDALRWLLIGSIPAMPGLMAAGPINFDSFRSGNGRGTGGLLQSTELALAGVTPTFALLTDNPPIPWWLFLWLLAIFVAGRFTVRPLARLATRATLQRDLVVAATEAERARLAADIHDDALQELTLLVRRLEASGDTEGAEIGRTVADRLRAICGDLRLPILDDLGVGPALDWLVLRIERLAGGEVRLERSDDTRHSPDVELAIFRVAQEALANAVKHGSPPIVVRYRSTPAGISLAIDDAGPGITDQAPADAERAGRFGLLNMAQRAEQIGAILDIKRWPTGGTHVALEWRPR
jgi:signal transduction histidine kinase